MVGLGKMIKWNRWNETSSNHWDMESMKVTNISTMSQSASHGKYSVLNGYFKVMCEVKWTLSWGNKVGKREINNPFSYTRKQE